MKSVNTWSGCYCGVSAAEDINCTLKHCQGRRCSFERTPHISPMCFSLQRGHTSGENLPKLMGRLISTTQGSSFLDKKPCSGNSAGDLTLEWSTRGDGVQQAGGGRLLGAQVAMKRIPDVLASPEQAKRVLREVAILRRLQHQNVIGLRDAFTRPSATGAPPGRCPASPAQHTDPCPAPGGKAVFETDHSM